MPSKHDIQQQRRLLCSVEGNKGDIDGQREVTYDEAKRFADDNDLLYIETSAKTGEHVEDAFIDTARKIYQNIQEGLIDISDPQPGSQAKPLALGRPGNSGSDSSGARQPSDSKCQC